MSRLKARARRCRPFRHPVWPCSVPRERQRARKVGDHPRQPAGEHHREDRALPREGGEGGVHGLDHAYKCSARHAVHTHTRRERRAGDSQRAAGSAPCLTCGGEVVLGACRALRGMGEPVVCDHTESTRVPGLVPRTVRFP
eukprot:4501397-Prymnesium_polylepis.2